MRLLTLNGVATQPYLMPIFALHLVGTHDSSIRPTSMGRGLQLWNQRCRAAIRPRSSGATTKSPFPLWFADFILPLLPSGAPTAVNRQSSSGKLVKSGEARCGCKSMTVSSNPRLLLFWLREFTLLYSSFPVSSLVDGLSNWLHLTVFPPSNCLSFRHSLTTWIPGLRRSPLSSSRYETDIGLGRKAL